MFRKILIFSIILIMCMGAVSASDDVNDTVAESDILNQTNDELQVVEESDTLQAADEDELSEEGEFLDVSEAYECLNNFRCEEGVWQWNSDDSTKTYFNTNDTIWLYPMLRDVELEQTAKIRAKELYQLYSHTRPDGTICFTAFPENLITSGENIAEGHVSCERVTEAWKETNDPYDGQGHRRNMLNPEFNRVGIAAYRVGGTIYWAQDFGCRYDPKPVENAIFYMENNSNSPYFTVQLPVYATGDFIVKLNGREVMRKSVFQGKANVTVFGLNTGEYDVELVYDGDCNYLSVNQTGKINVLGDASTSASFTYLNTLIKVGGKEVKLEKDYSFDADTDSDFKKGIIIPEAITIDGQGHTIDAKGQARIFLLYQGSKLKNIKMVNAFSDYGGALLSYRHLVLENCTFINNTASVYGGVAYAVGQIHDDFSRFINNTARFNGGALFGKAAVIVSQSTFIGNRGMNMTGAIYAQGTLSTDNSYYANNTNLQVYSMMRIIGNGNNLEDDYARVFANATVNYGVVNLDEDLTATQTILLSANNTVINGNGYSINANGRDRIFFITGNNVTIRNITLIGGYGVYDGGAIFCRASEISIIDSSFISNQAETGAAVSARGNVFVSSSKFIDNTANAGGAIFTDGGNVTVIDSVFENDDAVTFGAGAIYCQAMVNVTNSVFRDCDGPSYGVIFTNGKNYGKVYITGSTFINNTADNSSGVFMAFLGAEISNSVFENNSAGGDGGVICSYGNVSIVSSNFTGNTAGGNGGVLYHYRGNTSIESSNFRDNSAGSASGAVYGENIEVMNSNFTNNRGGSSNTFKGKVTGENSTVIENDVDVTLIIVGGKTLSSVEVTAGNVTYQDSVTVRVTVENNTVVTYTVKTVDGDVVVAETVIDDLSKPIKLDLGAGDYLITVNNAGNDDIIGSSASAYFSVCKASSSVEVTVANVTYPDDVVVSVSVVNEVSVSYIIKTVGGDVVVAQTSISDLSNPLQLDLTTGDYVITVTNDGNDNINGSSASAYFSVCKASSSVEVTAGNVTYPASVIVDVTVENSNVVTYTVKTVGGDVVVAETVIDDLSKSIKLDLGIGDYVITVNNAGNDNISGSSDSAYFSVCKALSSVDVSVGNVTYPASVIVGVTVENSTVVTYTVKTVGGDVVVPQTSISDLSNPLQLDLAIGDYVITVNNAGNDNIGGSSASAYFSVCKALSSVEVTAGNVTYPDEVVVSVSVVNATNVTYVVKTASGNIVIGETIWSDLSKSLKLNLSVGDYVITVNNAENDYIDGSSASAYFTVFKASGNGNGSGSQSGSQSDSGSDSKTEKIIKKSTKITASKKTFKAKAKTKKYSVTLKSGKKAVGKVRVVLKIKGKTYRATTNTKGKATFKITLKKKGTFTAKITFAGNKYYKKSSKSVKIKFR